MILEKNLNKLFSRLPIFWKKLYPHRLHNGQYVEGEPFDYLILREGEVFCFDAKEQKDNVLYFSEIPIGQFNNLLAAEKQGAKVFFLIYFVKPHKLCFIHPKTIIDDNKATPDSPQVDNSIKKLVLKYFTCFLLFSLL